LSAALRLAKNGARSVGFDEDEDGNDHVKCVSRPAPLGDIGEFGAQFHATFGRKRLRLGEPSLGEVDGEHVEALFGEPYAVAAFAVGD
jgi:hypothetical protein